MKKKSVAFVCISICLLLVSELFVLGFSFVYNKSFGEILRNCIFSLFFVLGLIYIGHYSFKFNKLNYDNEEHPLRFTIIYFVGFVFSCLFPMIDKRGWFYLSISVALLLFSNTLIAVYSTFGLLMSTLLMCKSPDVITVIVYFLSCLIAVLLFQDIENNLKVGPSIVISNLILFSLETAGFVMLENIELSAEQFVMPIVNVAVNSVIVFFSLKYFNSKVANRYRNKYLEINDQEYKVLIDLKNQSKEEYFRSIHTAYLTERIATAIGADVYAAKNCAYYHRIKKVFSFDLSSCINFLDDNEFPPKASELLLSYLFSERCPSSKEAGIVYISDKFISTLMIAFAKDKLAKIDYDSLVALLFEKDFIKDALVDSDLTLKDIAVIKEIILKETLYYDFLR